MKKMVFNYFIENIHTSIINRAIEESYSRPKSKTSYTIVTGRLDNSIFFKKLNIKKIEELYEGDYLHLWKTYFESLREVIPLNDIFGILRTNTGEVYEFSKAIPSNKILSEGTTQKWKEVEKLYLEILGYIDNIIQYQVQSRKTIGLDTSIWNFTIDGKLFDLDPPRLILKDEDSSFIRKNDIHHCKRTLYRYFTEIGMKSNLLATVIIALRDGNFIIPDIPEGWLNLLSDYLVQSVKDKNKQNELYEIFNCTKCFQPDFLKHPIDIILTEKVKGEKMKKDNKITKFIFVAGPSESGKSGGIIHIKAKFPQIKHLKIKNIFSAVYKDSKSELPYEEWYAHESENNFHRFWDNYINKATEMSDDAEIVIMDTMYGVKEIQYLSQKMGKNVGVLYIDAPEQERIRREYDRLRTDSPYSDRKADLSITFEQVTERTRRKDDQKRKLGTFEYRNLCYDQDGTLFVSPNGLKFSNVIDNDGTVEEFYAKLDRFIEEELIKVQEMNIN